MMSNIINVFFRGSVNCKTDPIYQYDYGQILHFSDIDLPSTFEVHFSNDPKNEATIQIGENGNVNIPDMYLLSGQPVYFWIFLHSGLNDGETEFSGVSPVIKKSQQIPDSPTPVEQSVITETIAALNSAVQRVESTSEEIGQTIAEALAEAKNSGEFDGKDGPPGKDGTDGVSPAVTIASITGGHSVTITDADHPNGQTFDVMDGAPGTGISVHICSAAEYDSTTRVPTVQNPGTNTFYFVPAENGASPDMFVEWIYTNNAWELFGSASVEVPVQDVQVNGTSILNNGVANVPIASASALGVVSPTGALYINSNNKLAIDTGGNSQFKAGAALSAVITPNSQHQAAFYGLAKAAGDTTQSQSDNAVGTYTAEAKAAIQQMLGVPSNDDIPDVQVNGTSVVTNGVANVPLASSNEFGAIKLGDTLSINAANKVNTKSSSSAVVKLGSASGSFITPEHQHESAFYGLAKAAGADMASSSNPVGTYTAVAKSAIFTMLTSPVSVSSSTPTINALPGIQYVCGEVSTLDITLPTSGIVDVVFQSGSTPTVLTITPPSGVTVKWANGFDPTALEADTTYEINIANGLGVAVGWT